MLISSLIQNWKPLVEIIILWYIIYRVMLFFEGTRALQVLRGLIILLFAFFIFEKLNFTVLDWLFRQLFAISIIAILVIFQPEIRGALAQLGKRKLFKHNLKDVEIDLMVKQIRQAGESLAKIKLGGLIAIERNDSLNGYVQSGEIIDARISADLIQAIFTPNNPLHDGAIIIQQDRISAAGCILPLTSNQELNRVFGTRHRAALGLSEESDAILIVISEERQDISIIYRNKFYKDLGGVELELKLLELFKN